MSIANEAYDFINNNINLFSYFKKSNEVHKQTVKKLYNKVVESNDFIETFVNKENIVETKVNIDATNKQHIKSKYNLQTTGNYTSSHILNEINNIKKIMTYDFKIQNIHYTINFMIIKKNDERIIEKYLKHMIKNIYFLISYMDMNMQSLTVNILLSDAKKQKNTNTNIILNSKNINTGVTYACKTNGYIFLYRKEELMKVFIHELMHSKCLDFSMININKNLINTIKSMFDIKSDFLISETYSEFWANIINTLFVSYQVSHENFEDFYENFTILHITEKLFSIHQMVSVLDYMSLTYEDLLQKNKKKNFKEDTNVFAYFILKGIWLFFSNEYISLMKRKNDNLIKVKKECIKTLINNTLKYYNHEHFKQIYKIIEKKYKKHKHSKKIDQLELQNSLRMSILKQKLN